MMKSSDKLYNFGQNLNLNYLKGKADYEMEWLCKFVKKNRVLRTMYICKLIDNYMNVE